MILLTFMAIFLATTIGEIAETQTFVMTVLGTLGTFIVQGIKKYSGVASLRDTKALNLTVIVSVALAVIGAFVTDAFTAVSGEGVTVGSVINGAFIVFGVATLVYKYLLSKDAPIDVPATPLT